VIILTGQALLCCVSRVSQMFRGQFVNVLATIGMNWSDLMSTECLDPGVFCGPDQLHEVCDLPKRCSPHRSAARRYPLATRNSLDLRTRASRSDSADRPAARSGQLGTFFLVERDPTVLGVATRGKLFRLTHVRIPFLMLCFSIHRPYCESPGILELIRKCT
jgi:hypothetical protein